MRSPSLMILVAIFLMGCAQVADNPVASGLPADDSSLSVTAAQEGGFNDPHRLWGEWTFYFNEDHSRVDAVPRRTARQHHNVPRFLEEYCTNCLQITNVHGNGDGTIDLSVRITHPFPNHPEYTGFDMKGIIMFTGSHAIEWDSKKFFPYKEPALISWRELGDPELLNADGYTPYWCPQWESGSGLPLFNYWIGKYTRGTPTANINAYLNFYTDEERHMFRVGGSVVRTYHIWLPPGPVVAGYAVDACWEPPTVTPVTDPVNDFPYSANQPESYYFRLVVNNNEVITFEECCGSWLGDCSTLWVESLEWYGIQPNRVSIRRPDAPQFAGNGLEPCLPGTAPDDEFQSPGGLYFTEYHPHGRYRGAALAWRLYPNISLPAAYYIFDWEVDIPE